MVAHAPAGAVGTCRRNFGKIFKKSVPDDDRAPLDAPQTELDPDNIRPGIWNVFPTYSGDHVSLQGGMMRRNDTREFYLSLLTMIEKCLS